MTKIAEPPKKYFVPVSPKEYEEFVWWKKAIKIHLDEQWFWTPEWQAKEKEAEYAIRDGRVNGPFTGSKSLLRTLKQKLKA